MRTLTVTFFLLISCLTYAQEEIKMPELDTSNKVYTLEFSPDSQDEEVISAYMKGTTEKDSLRFWAEGTILIQNVMVTVLSPDKKTKIKVDIVKNHWEDSKINGYLEEGVFQESFDTSSKFGIVITSDTPNIPYYLAVWTSGELIPDMSKLYFHASDENRTSGQNNTQGISSVVNNSEENSNSGTNFFMFAIIGILAIIASFLGFMVFKKKKGTVLFVLIFLFSSPEILNAQSQSLGSIIFRDISSNYPKAQNLARYARELREAGYGRRRPLDPYEEADSEANVSPAGGPRLPSSCLPPRYGTTTSTRNNNINSSEIDSNSTSSKNSSGSNDDENEKVTENYQEAVRKANEDYQNGIQEANSERQKGIQKAIENYSQAMSNAAADYANNMSQAGGDPNKIEIATDNNLTRISEIDATRARRQNQLIATFSRQQSQLAISLQTRLSQLASEKAERIQNSNGQSDNLGKDEERQDKKQNNEGDESKGLGSGSESGSGSGFDHPNNSSSSGSERNGSNDEACNCLDRAYIELDKRRLNLERLRIIYAHSMKKIRAGIAFGDNVSGVHGVSGLAWQSQKMIILKESIPTLEKAYDDKYAEMIEALEENLLEIDRCEKLLGYENWYNHAGFIYFQFMADKYKRN